jgi:hypothetical protein
MILSIVAIMLDVGVLQSAKSLEVVMIITQDKFGESVESCFRQDWNIHYSQQQQQQQQQLEQKYQHFDVTSITPTVAPPSPTTTTTTAIASSTATTLTTHTYIEDHQSSSTKIPMVVKVLPTCQACTLAIGRIVGKS